MNPFCNARLEQLRSEAKIEHLIRTNQPEVQGFTELEQLTKLILKLRFLGVQLEVRRWVNS